MEFELPRCLAQLARFDTSGEFDKDRVLEIHKEGYKQFTDLGDKKPLFNFSNYLPTAAELSRPSPRLKRLRPIALSQLEPGERSRGRVLYGTLCVDAFKVTGIMTCLEDEAGDAVRVSIYNAAPSNCTLADVQKLFPKGTKVAIKEPFLKLATDGMFIVRVDQPANVVTLERSPSQTQSSDPDELRSEGNRCFADGDWERAIEYYSKCIAAVESHGSSMPSSKTMNPKEKIAGAKDARGALMLAYSNRSEAWMKLRNYQKALTDSQSALELDPTHLKSIFRKGRALHGVEQYEKACACFEAALEKHPGEKELEGALEKSRRCLKGQFLLGRGCRKEDDPMCSSSDYSGTLQVSMKHE